MRSKAKRKRCQKKWTKVSVRYSYMLVNLRRSHFHSFINGDDKIIHSHWSLVDLKHTQTDTHTLFHYVKNWCGRIHTAEQMEDMSSLMRFCLISVHSSWTFVSPGKLAYLGTALTLQMTRPHSFFNLDFPSILTHVKKSCCTAIYEACFFIKKVFPPIILKHFRERMKHPTFCSSRWI